MSKFVERARVVAGAFVTWAVFASTALSVALVELEPYAHVEFVGVALKYGAAAVTAIGAAVAVVRRVTEVPVPERGLLPPDEFDSIVQQEFWGPR